MGQVEVGAEVMVQLGRHRVVGTVIEARERELCIRTAYGTYIVPMDSVRRRRAVVES